MMAIWRHWRMSSWRWIIICRNGSGSATRKKVRSVEEARFMKVALAILAILLVIGLLVGSAFVSRRNQMAVKREAVNAAWSQVDVVLQRRADLIRTWWKL